MENILEKKGDWYDCYWNFVCDLNKLTQEHFDSWVSMGLKGEGTMTLAFLLSGIELIKTELTHLYSKSSLEEERLEEEMDLDDDEDIFRKAA